MKKHVYLTPIALFAMMVGASASTAQEPTDQTFNPGDKIGDFLITTGDEATLANNLFVHCPIAGIILSH